MQDIDFDEIDRAVSSVTNPGRTAVPPRPVETPSVNETTPTPATIVEPSAQPADQPISAHAAPSLAARRSSGRFMDVVHPSSDMRPHAPAELHFDREETIPAERTEVAERPAVAAPAAFHWPDPIDMADNSPIAPVAAPVIEAAPVVPTVSDDDLFATSLESPFLSNTKVEKRPLGAFSYPESDLPLIDDFADQPVATAPVASDSKATDVENAVAEDVVSEAVTNEVVTPTSTSLDEETLLLEADNEEVEEPEEPAVPTTVVAVATAMNPASPVEEAPVGPTSITQQYKEHPSTDTQPSGAIYDTEAYHQPLAHPAKKHSSLLVIVWILGLIVVGGGIGAAMYFFVLPML